MPERKVFVDVVPVPENIRRLRFTRISSLTIDSTNSKKRYEESKLCGQDPIYGTPFWGHPLEIRLVLEKAGDGVNVLACFKGKWHLLRVATEGDILMFRTAVDKLAPAPRLLEEE